MVFHQKIPTQHNRLESPSENVSILVSYPFPQFEAERCPLTHRFHHSKDASWNRIITIRHWPPSDSFPGNQVVMTIPELL